MRTKGGVKGFHLCSKRKWSLGFGEEKKGGGGGGARRGSDRESRVVKEKVVCFCFFFCIFFV